MVSVGPVDGERRTMALTRDRPAGGVADRRGFVDARPTWLDDALADVRTAGFAEADAGALDLEATSI